ncbi:Succinate dehydrogenase subunit 5, mitochondrial-like protein [Drosera capensis]
MLLATNCRESRSTNRREITGCRFSLLSPLSTEEMGKTAMLRQLLRPPLSTRYAAVSATHFIDGRNPLSQDTTRSIFSLSRTSTSSDPRSRGFSDNLSAFSKSIGSTRFFSEDVAHFPDIKDPEIKNVFKDFIAANWDELPESLIHDAKTVLSKDTDDKTGKEALANVFCSAEAVEEFIGILVSLKLELDDSVGLSGEDVKPLPDKLVNALRVAYSRYTTYLDSFGPDESYLRKKVESELGTRMIHLKMRCSGIGSEWGKVTVLGTSGISGSYVEQRAP